MAKEMVAEVYQKGFTDWSGYTKNQQGEVRPADVTLTSIEFDGRRAVLCVARDILKVNI